MIVEGLGPGEGVDTFSWSSPIHVRSATRTLAEFPVGGGTGLCRSVLMRRLLACRYSACKQSQHDECKFFGTQIASPVTFAAGTRDGKQNSEISTDENSIGQALVDDGFFTARRIGISPGLFGATRRVSIRAWNHSLIEQGVHGIVPFGLKLIISGMTGAVHHRRFPQP